MSASLCAQASKTTGRTFSLTVEFEPVIEGRFAAIKQGFERIRAREPRH
jgi:hypothetical protein